MIEAILIAAAVLVVALPLGALGGWALFRRPSPWMLATVIIGGFLVAVAITAVLVAIAPPRTCVVVIDGREIPCVIREVTP